MIDFLKLLLYVIETTLTGTYEIIKDIYHSTIDAIVILSEYIKETLIHFYKNNRYIIKKIIRAIKKFDRKVQSKIYGITIEY